MCIRDRYQLSQLDVLEAEAIFIMREVVAEFEKPVLLFSGGKDSIVMLRVAQKAFWPARIPFVVMHVDTGHNFPEVLEYRDRRVAELGVNPVSYTHLDVYKRQARGFVLTAIPLILVLSEVCRWVLRHWLGAQRRDGLCFSPTVVVGRVDSVADMVREIQNNPASGLTVVAACVSGLDSGDYLGSSVGGVPVYGGPETALLAVNEYQAEVVAVSSHSDLVGHSLRRLGWALEELGVDLVVSPGIVEVAGPRLTLRPTAGMSLLHVERPLHSGLRAVGKMLLDRVLALSITFFFLPLMVAVAIAIKLENPGPVFFRQTRIGAQGRPCLLYTSRCV